jgi:hypothetical protein
MRLVEAHRQEKAQQLDVGARSMLRDSQVHQLPPAADLAGFTLGHELGHWLIPYHTVERQKFVCSSRTSPSATMAI